MDEHQEGLNERSLHRMLFFTDAVFAIVLTLLVLELRPPGEGGPEHAADVVPLSGPLFAFVLSFLIISIFWIAHMATTRRLIRFDWPTTVANLVFLFPICLIPFVSAWVGGAAMGPQGWSVYCLALIATSLANVVLVFVQSRDGGRLMAGGVTLRERLYRMGRAASPGLAFAVGLAGALADEVRVSQYCWVLIPVFFAAFRLLKPKREPKPA
ncbi:TMEM175 family protein [Phenylobacterium sp.]|uniref:TMEM175 family protein n=1 Tax=Phenylobacterium sp. TaxID=1871053 RepID=UPI00286B5E8D|nr:TMEM175 family protein [Phenylobacterium sp.]